MKKGGVLIASLIFFVCLSVVPLFADANTVALESVVVESFDGDSSYEWITDGIKYASKKDYGLFPVYPQALHRTAADAEGKQAFGLNGQFQRRGHNWIDIYPVSKDNPEGGAVEIPLWGFVQYVDVWVWGSNLNYQLEVYLRDYQGMIHRLEMGSLNFLGWKNLQTAIPPNFPMSERTLPVRSNGSSSFVKFRLWTDPYERVNNFYLYLDHLKVLSDTFTTRFDGDDLADAEKAQELWAGVNQQ
ncbi:MAG: flagellar filament outer layer protein FlaA [Spirochaetaceae bacterium]|jgi:hypothetical protein|nr:flagellar filament outer layer protein FlaA [Spirochaetaceae bacterium]